jgi:hypothetical protein
MQRFKKASVLAAALCASLAASAQAVVVNVPAGDITVATTWTAGNEYNLQGQVFVTNGATLTIQAGAVVRSTTGVGGSLAITRGSKIIAAGTAANPIIWTSTNDNLGAPLNRVAVNEWGNLTICGEGLVGAGTNNVGAAYTGYAKNAAVATAPTLTPSGLTFPQMEGFVAGVSTNHRHYYGGNNDNDDSGTLTYNSFRFGGKVAGLGNELNGLSLGAVGRNTDIRFVEIFCNVDDGFEIWGGTVNLKNISIWNSGDDSFDVDQGWRGKAQFGLIVQGNATGAVVAQGSGVSDNAFEIDGAEPNTSVPQTTATLYNFTVIMQPDGQRAGGGGVGGDVVFCFRDNAKVQYRNMLIVEQGSHLIVEERSETAATDPWRYGNTSIPASSASVPDFTNTATGVWGMAYTEAHNTANATTGGHANASNYLGVAGPMTQANLEALYAAQSAGSPAAGQGFLCEVTDTLIYTNPAFPLPSYTTSNTVGVTTGGASTTGKAVVVQNGGTLPILGLTRASVIKWANNANPLLEGWMGEVATLDPRRNPANTDTVSVATAPLDGFFSPAQYRGAFDQVNWMAGWSTPAKFGIMTGADTASDPSVTIDLTSRVGFTTVAGDNYVVEESTDGVVWTPVQYVVGTPARTVYYADLAGLTAGKLYRAVAQ